MRAMVRTATAALAVALLAPAAPAALMIDYFDSAASAANYTQVQTSADTEVIYGYDYSVLGIPLAPSTPDNSTLGLRMRANIAAPTGVEAVTLHTNQVFTGAYKVKFDAWINANGGFPAGGPGSTQYLTAGVGGDGATVNRNNLGTGADTGSGGWIAYNAEGQSTSQDYVIFKGANQNFPESGQFRAGNTSGVGNGMDNANAYYAFISPSGVNTANLPVQGSNNGGTQTGTTAVGAAGFAWHRIVLHVDPNGGVGGATVTKWSIDGVEIADINAGKGTSYSTDGRVTLGYLDAFSSVSGNPALTYGIIDNLVIVPEPGSIALAACGVCGLIAAGRRRLVA